MSSDDFSVILKVIRHSTEGHENWLSGEDPAHWFYWRREALAYSSGLTASLSGGLRGPRCFGTFERTGSEISLWLEDLGPRSGSHWNVDRFGLAARHLGAAQGEFLAGRPFPQKGWVSRDWLRKYLSQRSRDDHLLDEPDLWSDRMVKDFLADASADEFRRLWRDRERFLAVLDGLPRTLCHLDVHPDNLFASGVETVLIDWAFVGAGAVGEDPVNLVLDAVFDFHVRPERISELFDVVFEGYVDGLREAGWDGDLDSVRLGFAAAAAAKFGWIVPLILRAVASGRGTLNGRPFAEAIRWWAPASTFVLTLADEARRA